MAMTVKEFVQDFKEKKIKNTQINENAVAEYITKTLEVKGYLPFKFKREMVEMIVRENITVVNGLKKSDAISQYVSFITAMLKAHTNLEFSDNPIDDYDALAESGLLAPVVETFKASYDECDILLKMALAAELEDNNFNAIVAKFLDGILDRLDDVVWALEDKLGELDLNDIVGTYFKPEDLEKLSKFLSKYGK